MNAVVHVRRHGVQPTALASCRLTLERFAAGNHLSRRLLLTTYSGYNAFYASQEAGEGGKKGGEGGEMSNECGIIKSSLRLRLSGVQAVRGQHSIVDDAQDGVQRERDILVPDYTLIFAGRSAWSICQDVV